MRVIDRSAYDATSRVHATTCYVDATRGPRLELSIDFCGPLPAGEYLLVIMDEFSRFPVIDVVRRTSAETVIQSTRLSGNYEIRQRSRSMGKFGKHLCKRTASVILGPLAPGKCASRGTQQAAHESHQNCQYQSHKLEKRNAKVPTSVSLHSPRDD